MSTADKSLLIAAGLLVAFALGRYTAAPPQESTQVALQEEIDVQTDETLASEEIADHSSAEGSSERVETSHERVRIVYRERSTTPEGAVTEKHLEVDAELLRLAREAETYREEAASLRLQLAAERASTAVLRTTLDLRHEVRSPPTWAVGATAVYDTSTGRTAFGPQATFRLAGPLLLHAAVAAPGIAPPLLQGGLLVEF